MFTRVLHVFSVSRLQNWLDTPRFIANYSAELDFYTYFTCLLCAKASTLIGHASFYCKLCCRERLWLVFYVSSTRPGFKIDGTPPVLLQCSLNSLALYRKLCIFYASRGQHWLVILHAHAHAHAHAQRLVCTLACLIARLILVSTPVRGFTGI